VNGALHGVSRVLAGLWFRSLRLEGRLPDGPVLLVLNHPNGLLDPLVPSALLRPAPRFMAKATLWNLLPLRPLLALFDPIPVRRMKDEGSGTDATRNQEAFEAVFAAFTGGARVGIFAEGISHSGADLAPLKTGAARLVLGSPVAVSLVPAGLVYGAKETWRHSALLRVGAPIPFEDLRPRGSDPEAVKELTARLRAALLPLTLHGDGHAHTGLAHRLAWLLAEGPAERADLDRVRDRVRRLLAHLDAATPDEVETILTAVAEAEAWLAAKGLRPDQVGHAYAPDQVRAWLPRALGHLAAALLLLPCALLFWPPYKALGWLVGRINDDEDQTATFKLLGAALFYPAWIAVLAALAWGFLGWAGLGVFTAADFAALAALPLLERVAEDRQALRGWARRRDPDAAHLLDAKAQLLARFPDLG
jgi:1-acyl-sn-glycerol-3-phosphate acyltransferase